MEVSGRRGDGEDDSADSQGILLCDNCIFLNKYENAEHYCGDCNEYFCDNCCTVHKMSKLSNTHKLLSKNEMPTQKLQSSDQNMCIKHKGEIIKYFCRGHNDFYCTICVALFHKECTVDYIDHIATNFGQSTEYKSLRDKISHLAQQLHELKTSAASNRHDIQNIHEQYRSDVKKFRVEINNILDSMENTILTEAKGVKECDLSTVDSVSTTCDSMVTDLLELSSNLDNQKKYKQQRQLVISAKKAQARVSEWENKMSNLSNRNKIRSYKFQPSDKLVHSLQSVDSLGKMGDRKNAEGRTKGEQELPVTHDPKSVRAKYVGQILVKHSQDTYWDGCGITGSEMLDENRIVLVDHFNDRVKLVDIKKDKITSYIKLPTDPWDITRNDGNQLVVTCRNKLVFLSVDPSLTVNKEIEVGGDCRGIVFNDNKLFVTDVEPQPAIKIISLKGEILQTFSKDTSGQPLFKSPSYITLSCDKSTLFVSDHDNNRVTSLNLKGEVQHVYIHNKLKEPRGMAADRHCNIYIAGWGSNNIHQISTQCRPLQIVLKDTQVMKGPQSVTYCETGNKLYIGHRGYGNNILSVYQL